MRHDRFTVMAEFPPHKRTITVYDPYGSRKLDYYHGQFPWTYFLMEIESAHLFRCNHASTYVADLQLSIKGNHVKGLCRELISSNALSSRIFLNCFNICMDCKSQKNLWDMCENIVSTFFSSSFSIPRWHRPAMSFDKWANGESLTQSPIYDLFQFNCTENLTQDKLSKFTNKEFRKMLNSNESFSQYLETL